VMPSNELISTMTKYNQELINAGVMVDGAGLRPVRKAPASGSTARFEGQPPNSPSFTPGRIHTRRIRRLSLELFLTHELSPVNSQSNPTENHGGCYDQAG
jgi:hypothetical protein